MIYQRVNLYNMQIHDSFGMSRVRKLNETYKWGFYLLNKNYIFIKDSLNILMCIRRLRLWFCNINVINAITSGIEAIFWFLFSFHYFQVVDVAFIILYYYLYLDLELNARK